jgi:hypothetical protein
MKAILEFNLDDLDDQYAHRRCVASLDMALLIWELVYNTRKDLSRKIKHALEEDKNITAHDSLELLYDELRDLLAEHNIDINTLVV